MRWVCRSDCGCTHAVLLPLQPNSRSALFCRCVRWKTATNVCFLRPRRSRTSTCGEYLLFVSFSKSWTSWCSRIVLTWLRSCLYRISNTPHGPSAKFLVQNSELFLSQSWSPVDSICLVQQEKLTCIIVSLTVHTLAELKMTGNCLKGSRPLLSFDPVSGISRCKTCCQPFCNTYIFMFNGFFWTNLLVFFTHRNLIRILSMLYWKSSSSRSVYELHVRRCKHEFWEMSRLHFFFFFKTCKHVLIVFFSCHRRSPLHGTTLRVSLLWTTSSHSLLQTTGYGSEITR